MSTGWIEGSDRLINAVGDDLAEEILDSGYEPILAKVEADGSINYFILDENAAVIRGIGAIFVP